MDYLIPGRIVARGSTYSGAGSTLGSLDSIDRHRFRIPLARFVIEAQLWRPLQGFAVPKFSFPGRRFAAYAAPLALG
jgi:hypothetical protein